MNKEEFQTKENDINSKIRKLKSQKIKLEKEYIKSNAKYPVGSKACITTPASTYIRLDNHESVVIPEKKQYAYIKGYNIGFYDTIDPSFGKVRKDGTMSDVNLYVNLTNTTIGPVKE